MSEPEESGMSGMTAAWREALDAGMYASFPGGPIAKGANMSEQDIVERLRAETANREVLTPLGVLINTAADIIVTLRYDHDRDAEKIASLQRQVEALERLCGAISKGDGDYREITKDLPRRWPHVGTHE